MFFEAFFLLLLMIQIKLQNASMQLFLSVYRWTYLYWAILFIFPGFFLNSSMNSVISDLLCWRKYVKCDGLGADFYPRAIWATCLGFLVILAFLRLLDKVKHVNKLRQHYPCLLITSNIKLLLLFYVIYNILLHRRLYWRWQWSTYSLNWRSLIGSYHRFNCIKLFCSWDL